MLNQFARIGNLALLYSFNLIYIIASATRRDKNIWLFSAWNGKKYGDNPKSIFEYVQLNLQNIDAYWITKSQKLNKELQSKNIRSHYYMSLKGILLQLKAGVIIFTHSAEWEFFAPLLAKNTTRIQTWHGMPIKRIGYDDNSGISHNRAALISKIYPFRSDHIDIAFASSSEDAEKYRSAFNINPSNVAVTGYARNDVIFSTRQNEAEPKYKTHVIYMPTLRGGIDSEFKLFQPSMIDLQETNKHLKNLDIQLSIRLHPVQILKESDKEILSKCDCIKLLEHNDSDNFYESLGTYDILITDYSGTFFDFMITSKPIIMAPIDIDDYMSKDRDLYYNYDELCPETPCMNWVDVLHKIKEIKDNGLKTIDADRYTMIKKRFHKYCDDQSSRRCAEQIIRFLT